VIVALLACSRSHLDVEDVPLIHQYNRLDKCLSRSLVVAIRETTSRLCLCEKDDDGRCCGQSIEMHGALARWMRWCNDVPRACSFRSVMLAERLGTKAFRRRTLYIKASVFRCSVSVFTSFYREPCKDLMRHLCSSRARLSFVRPVWVHDKAWTPFVESLCLYRCQYQDLAVQIRVLCSRDSPATVMSAKTSVVALS
jgi:hypothetical protein